MDEANWVTTPKIEDIELENQSDINLSARALYKGDESLRDEQETLTRHVLPQIVHESVQTNNDNIDQVTTQEMENTTTDTTFNEEAVEPSDLRKIPIGITPPPLFLRTQRIRPSYVVNPHENYHYMKMPQNNRLLHPHDHDVNETSANVSLEVKEYEAGSYAGEMVDGNRSGYGVLFTHHASSFPFKDEDYDKKGMADTSLVQFGRWEYDKQMDCGIIIRSEYTFEGDILENDPHGYGVALHFDGVMYTGSWMHGKPHGLGVMEYPDNTLNQKLDQRGWFVYGDFIFPVCSPLPRKEKDWVWNRFLPQPESGLVLLASKLEACTESQLRKGLNTWRASILDEVVDASRQCRRMAFSAWEKANIAFHMANEAHQKKQLDKLLEQEDMQHCFHLQRLHKEYQKEKEEAEFRIRDAMQEREISIWDETCQLQTLKHLESELAKIENDIQAAQECFDKSLAMDTELREIHKEIQAHQFQLQQLNNRIGNDVMITDNSTFILHPIHPEEKTKMHTKPAPSKKQFVCGVEGCECGIPTDSYWRISSAINGLD